MALKLSKAAQFLMAKKAELPKEVQTLLNQRKLRLIDTEIRHTAKITTAGGGTFHMLESDNNKTIGVSDFDGNKLDTGVNFACSKIWLGYAKDAEKDETLDSMVGKYTPLRSNFPTQLLGANLVIKQEGKVKMRIPIERFTTGESSRIVQGIEDALELETLILLTEQKQTQIELEFDTAQDMPSDVDSFLCVRMMGVSTQLR